MTTKTTHRGPVDLRLLRRGREAIWFGVGSITTGALTAAAIVAQAWLIASAVGDFFADRDLRSVERVLLPLAGIVTVRALLSWLGELLAFRTSATVKARFRSDLMRARLTETEQVSMSSGALITLMTQGLDALDGYFARYLPQLVLAVVVPGVLGIAIASADPLSAVIIAGTLPLIPIFMILVGWATQAKTKRRWQMQARLAHHFVDLMAGLPTLQVFGRAKAQAEGLRRTEQANRHQTLAVLRTAFLSALVLELVATLSVALVAVGIGLRVLDGHLTLTIGLFVLILAPEAYLPVRQVGVHYHEAADGMAAVEQAFISIEEHQAPLRAAVRSVQKGQLPIRFVHVGYRYPDADHTVISQCDLEISPGQIVAVTGPSGSGKSTLIDLLLGLRQPRTGHITVGEDRLDHLDLERWRSGIAWVGQHPQLLAGSIADNVRMGSPAASDFAVRDALHQAGASDLSPERVIGEGGEGLSAGEIRRVAVARALLRVILGHAHLLIMDEPTAGADTDREDQILASIRQAEVTTVMISHRSSAVAIADHVVRLDSMRAPATVRVGDRS